QKIRLGDSLGWYPVPVAFSPDGRLLAVEHPTIGPKFLQLVDVATRRPYPTLVRPYSHGPEIFTSGRTVFSPDGRLLVSSCWGHWLYLFDPNTGKLLDTLTGHISAITGIAFSPRGTLLVSCGGDRRPGGFMSGPPPEDSIRLWDVSQRQ